MFSLTSADAVTTSDIAAVVVKADTLGAASSALWFAEDKEAPEIDGLGFERGWQPWWMECRPGDITPGATDRVRIATRVRRHDQGRAQLATPDGATLYASCGFAMLGAGRTYWRHTAH